MKEVLDKLKIATTKSLTRQVLAAMEAATLKIEAEAFKFIGAKIPPLREESPAVAERFMENLHEHFEALTTLQFKDEPELEANEYDNLSLVDNDFLEAVIAMESMVKATREAKVWGSASLLTRLETMFPNQRIDETTNPLDPEQIGDSFNEAIRPLGLKAHYLLTIYREFNKTVFKNFEDVLNEANDVLIAEGVLPNLDLRARRREKRKEKLEANPIKTQTLDEIRSKSKVREQQRAGQSSTDMFEMMQSLVQGIAAGGKNALPLSNSTTEAADTQADTLLAEQQDLRKQQLQLMDMLSTIQTNMMDKPRNGTAAMNMDAASITESINAGLQAEAASGDMGEIDPKSSDVIKLVTLLYEAIWKDKALPIVMKELIGRTQIAIMKLALTDTTFFGDERHPGRVILNEFAMAGIAWTENDTLDEDPTYLKIKELVERILNVDEINNQFLQGLINELRAFKAEQGGSDANLEQRIREAAEGKPQIDDINEFVRQKINERVLKGYLDPSIRALLDTFLHEFLVKLVLKEGAAGGSWKPVMSTIDVMLWTVQAEKHAGDRKRFEKINPRLLDNLAKALEIGGASKTKITKIMRQLKQVQEYSFHKAETAVDDTQAQAGTDTHNTIAFSKQIKEPTSLPRTDPQLRLVHKLPIGVWLEFAGTSGNPVRCTLAAKIDSIDKLFFVDAQGAKIAELTRTQLAREIKAGTAKVVGEGTLVDRAMESVISNLKQSAPPPEAETSSDVASA